MQIKEASSPDYAAIAALIREEFPYVSFDESKIKERAETGKVVIFKAVEGKQMLGFIELQFLEPSIARINGLSVKQQHRNQGISKKLLTHALDFLKRKKVERVLLLVKQENEQAKKLYASMGFQFMGLYQEQLDNATVEEMELNISSSKPEYVT